MKAIFSTLILFSVFGFFAIVAGDIYVPKPMCGWADAVPCSRSTLIYQSLQLYVPLAPFFGFLLLTRLFSNQNGGIAELAIKLIGLALGYAAARVTHHYLKKCF
jgi:hypothetical protein